MRTHALPLDFPKTACRSPLQPHHSVRGAYPIINRLLHLALRSFPGPSVDGQHIWGLQTIHGERE